MMLLQVLISAFALASLKDEVEPRRTTIRRASHDVHAPYSRGDQLEDHFDGDTPRGQMVRLIKIQHLDEDEGSLKEALSAIDDSEGDGGQSKEQSHGMASMRRKRVPICSSHKLVRHRD